MARGDHTWTQDGRWFTSERDEPGTTWSDPGPHTVAVLDVTDLGGPWRYETGQQLDTDWAHEAAIYKAEHPHAWVMVAAHGADGPYVPLVEIDSSRMVTDTYPGGHYFTHGDIDVLRGVLGIER